MTEGSKAEVMEGGQAADLAETAVVATAVVARVGAERSSKGNRPHQWGNRCRLRDCSRSSPCGLGPVHSTHTARLPGEGDFGIRTAIVVAPRNTVQCSSIRMVGAVKALS